MNENCITYIDNRKLIHVTYMPYLSIGIYKKIKILARISEKNQYPIDFMILNLFKEKKYGNLHLKKIEFYKFIPRRIQSMFFKYKLIKKNIPWEKYKYIILRHVMYPDIDSIKMFKKYGNKIFSEHHTNEIMEIKSINKKLNLKKIIDFYLEKFLTPIKLKYSRGIIAVTKEIIDLEERKGGLKNSYLISNGCILSLNNIIKNNKFDNKILKIIFVSSVFYPWQGLDRILRSLKKYNGDLKIEFTIVGIINELELIKSINEINEKKGLIKIKWLKRLDSYDLDNEYKKNNIAVSTLALYRKNMKEACPLKSCEYIAKGIPFIYAYEDPNITDDYKYALKISNDNSLIDFKKIIEFVNEVYKEKDMYKNIYQYARKHVAYERKLEQYINLL